MKKVCDDWQAVLPVGKAGIQYYEEWETRAKNVAAEVFHVKTPAEANAIIAELVKSVNAKKVVTVANPLQDQAGTNEFLRTMGITVYTDPADIAEHAESAEVGISGVEFAVAETGSVCMDGYAYESRIVSMLPPLHIVFLKSSNIVPGVTEAFDIFSEVFSKGYLSFITGPSRTADIERVLTIGCHGPVRFAVIAIDDATQGGLN